MSATGELVIGVDGGGTKTVAWLAPLDDPTNAVVLGRGHAGPGNPRAAGFDVAQDNIEAAIAGAFAEAGFSRTTAAAACFGLAGAGREIEQERIAAWASEQKIAGKIRVTGDAEPILAAASVDNVGVALICGTGSLAWGRNSAGETARCGGWGYLLGDEGSAYAIARAGLVASVRVADGRGQETVLLDSLQHELGAATPADLVQCVYGPEMTREKLSALAKIVFDAAANDIVARSLINAAAHDLAEMVAVLCIQLKLFHLGYPLALAGSVIVNQPLLHELLCKRLEERLCSPLRKVIVADPVRGAVTLARSLAKQP